jgi:hypothetical protein
MQPVNAVSSSGTDFTPPSGFTTPDWIYVARDGSNPTSWNIAYASSANVSPATSPTAGTLGTNAVTERYAYAIYDEGSTLDLNVAGSPIYSTSTNSYSPVQPYKSALAYADLTQLPYLGSTNQTLSTALSATQQVALINAIVGWRNLGSAVKNATQAPFPGTSPAYTFTGTGTTTISTTNTASPTTTNSFDLNLLNNTTGLIGVGGSSKGTGPGASYNEGVMSQPGQTDNAFTSRQQLLQFFLEGLAQNSNFTLGSNTLATLENLMPYVGTFSRDLNQPSFAPPTSFPTSSSSSYNAPTSTNTASGGNDKGGGDTTINPAFLAATITSANSNWTRNDGSLALVGEPLVKKRFALSRLAWLTYLGPIATDSGTYNTATGISTLVTILKSYGYTDAFLKQGGPTNIYKYFGLSWVSDSRTNGDSQKKWVYNHENATYLTTVPSGSSLKPIRTLSTGSYSVLSQNREPDFFELLKAATTLGSVGKAYLLVPTAGSSGLPSNWQTMPYSYQPTRDNSVDLQILQMGANIIDQFQPSGYCARILFSDGILYKLLIGSTPLQEIRGVEDLPYIYRVREAKITIQDCSIPTGSNTLTQASIPALSSTNQLNSSNQGLVAVMQQPEIWNPHSWNTANPDTNPRPTSFRMVAYSTDPNTASSTYPPTSSTTAKIVPTLNCQFYYDSSSGHIPSPTFVSCPTSSVTGAVWNESTTELDFSIPLKSTNQYYNYNLFREPTLLIKPGVPTGSGLQVGASNLIETTFSTTGTNTVLGSGATCIYSHWPATQIYSNSTTSGSNGPVDNQQYIGFLGATGPAAWYTSIPAYGVNSSSPTSTTNGYVGPTDESMSSPVPVTYRLQYKNSSNQWVTYDEKAADYVCAYGPNYAKIYPSTLKTFIPGSDEKQSYAGYYPNSADNIIGGEAGEACLDPRTSRFGMIPVGPWGTEALIQPGSEGNYPPEGSLEFPVTQVNGPYLATESIGWAASSGLQSVSNHLNVHFPNDGYGGTWFSSAISQLALTSMRPDWQGGYTNCNFTYLVTINTLNGGVDAGPNVPGWYPTTTVTASGATSTPPYYTTQTVMLGMMEQNNPSEAATVTSTQHLCQDAQGEMGKFNQYFSDADGVVRRAMSAYVPTNGTYPAVINVYGQPSGLPMDIGTDYSGATTTSNTGPGPQPIPAEQASRPIMLNRPFRSVSDLDYVFSGTPWRNLDMGTPESGSKALLDVFCINDTNDPNGLVAGKVNLNTRQAPVLAAILSGAYKDEFDVNAATTTNSPGNISPAYATAIAKALVTRTGSTAMGQGPLANLSELVGKWNAVVHPNSVAAVAGNQSYVGFSSDLVNTSNNDLTAAQTVASITDSSNSADTRVERFRNAPIRALANAGTTRVWNLMIDVIAQTGRFPSSATGLANFNVEGERRYWVHVAIDRYTGRVLDEQIEEVKE